jgi:type II secretory pathway pseudopilin PulG
MKIAHSTRGQTLLELIVAIAVVALVVTGLIVAVTASLHYGQNSKLSSQALKYAQEGIELTREKRDTSPWDTFLALGAVNSNAWCVDKNRVWTGTESTCAVNIDNVFTRTVTLTWNDPIMHVESLVEWTSGNQTNQKQSILLETFLTEWR